MVEGDPQLSRLPGGVRTPHRGLRPVSWLPGQTALNRKAFTVRPKRQVWGTHEMESTGKVTPDLPLGTKRSRQRGLSRTQWWPSGAALK